MATVIDPSATIGRGTRLEVADGARLEIGAGAVLGERCVIVCRESVTIGAHARLGDEVVLIDFDHGIDDVETPIRLQPMPTSPIVIGERARLDFGAVVLRGVTVGAGAHVGTRSVVVRDVAPGAEVAGIPAHSPRGPRRQVQVPAPRKAASD
jgi:acetyltransferase-like isoleucine patch superfamily enzyme